MEAKSDKDGSSPVIDLDYVLVNELGQFGRFQLRNMALVSIAIAASAFFSEYIFTAATVPHRCRIEECGEYNKDVVLEPEWIFNAIPETSNGFASCERFVSSNLGINGSLDNCPANLFNRANTVECDGFVYGRDNSVVYDFDLGCQEWLRALSGTLNSIGTLLVLPITGYISDRFGRRIALVINLFNTAVLGVVKAFSVNYPMYMVMQIVQTTLGAGIYSSAYIFAAELVGPKWRVVASATCSSMFAIGLVILGAVAWVVQPWRYLILAINVPVIILISYYWILDESVRWLLSKQKYDQARSILEKVARVNKKEISEKSMAAIMSPPTDVPAAPQRNLIKAVINSRVLLRRVCTTPIWWITTTFVYYGLSINSTSLSDTMYLNFILTSIIEVPGFYCAAFVLNKIGRKPTLSIGFLICAACNLVFIFIPSDLTVLRLVIFLAGKFFISMVFTSLYLFTSELYPTEFRHTFLGFSSMIGRIGSITAPLTPVLADYWHGTPSLMFALMGFISGVLVLTQPETLGTKLPDTLEEAEAIGQPSSKLS